LLLFLSAVLLRGVPGTLALAVVLCSCAGVGVGVGDGAEARGEEPGVGVGDEGSTSTPAIPCGETAPAAAGPQGPPPPPFFDCFPPARNSERANFVAISFSDMTCTVVGFDEF